MLVFRHASKFSLCISIYVTFPGNCIAWRLSGPPLDFVSYKLYQITSDSGPICIHTFFYFFHFLKLSISRQFSWNSEKVLRCMYFKHTAACRKWLEGIKETLLLVPFLLSQRWNVILRRKLLKIKYNLLILMQILRCKTSFQVTCTIKRTPLHGSNIDNTA